jgi:hypothetical protein
MKTSLTTINSRGRSSITPDRTVQGLRSPAIPCQAPAAFGHRSPLRDRIPRSNRTRVHRSSSVERDTVAAAGQDQHSVGDQLMAHKETLAAVQHIRDRLVQIMSTSLVGMLV